MSILVTGGELVRAHVIHAMRLKRSIKSNLLNLMVLPPPPPLVEMFLCVLLAVPLDSSVLEEQKRLLVILM